MAHGVWPGAATIAQLSLLGTCQGQSVVNVLHFYAPAANESAFTGDSDRITWATGLATDWRTNVRAGWLACHTSDYSLNEIRSQVMEVPGLFEHRLTAISDTTGAPAVGTDAGTADDLSTAVVVKWRTAIASRHTRGRTYIGPLNEGASALGKTVPAHGQIIGITTWLTAMARYLGSGAGVTAGFAQCIYSRPYSHPHGAYVRRIGGLLTVVNDTTDFDGLYTPVVAASVDTTLRVQRRREIGVGN